MHIRGNENKKEINKHIKGNKNKKEINMHIKGIYTQQIYQHVD